MGCCSRAFYKLNRTVEIAGNLALTAANATAHAIKTGQVRAEDTLVQRRVEICRACPNMANGRCRLCGCYIAAKAGLAVSKCPINKW